MCSPKTVLSYINCLVHGPHYSMTYMTVVSESMLFSSCYCKIVTIGHDILYILQIFIKFHKTRLFRCTSIQFVRKYSAFMVVFVVVLDRRRRGFVIQLFSSNTITSYMLLSILQILIKIHKTLLISYISIQLSYTLVIIMKIVYM